MRTGRLARADYGATVGVAKTERSGECESMGDRKMFKSIPAVSLPSSGRMMHPRRGSRPRPDVTRACPKTTMASFLKGEEKETGVQQPRLTGQNGGSMAKTEIIIRSISVASGRRNVDGGRAAEAGAELPFYHRRRRSVDPSTIKPASRCLIAGLNLVAPPGLEPGTN